MTEQTTELTFLKSSRKRRIAAFLIDHVLITLIMVSFVFALLGPNFMDENNPVQMTTTMLLVMIPGFFLYFVKDCFNGVSAGKWMMGIMIRDENNQNEIPSFGRLFLRSLFIIIWPIEFIMLATNNQKKRLGDKVTNTVVLKKSIKPTKLPRILVLVGVGVAFFIFLFLFVGSTIKNSDAYIVATLNIEQNKEIINETGGVKGYGMMPTGNISITNGHGEAQLQIKVLGNKKDLDVRVYLDKEPDGQWRLVEMQKL